NHTDDVVELGNVAAPHGDLVAPMCESSPRTGRIDIHAGDAVAGSGQKGDHAPADEACAAHYHDGHAFPPPCHAPLGSTEGATCPVDGREREVERDGVARCIARLRADIHVLRLAVEKDVLEVPAVVDAVGLDGVVLDVGVPAAGASERAARPG